MKNLSHRIPVGRPDLYRVLPAASLSFDRRRATHCVRRAIPNQFRPVDPRAVSGAWKGLLTLRSTESRSPQAKQSKPSLCWPDSSDSISASHILASHFKQARSSNGLSRRESNVEYLN